MSRLPHLLTLAAVLLLPGALLAQSRGGGGGGAAAGVQTITSGSSGATNSGGSRGSQGGSGSTLFGGSSTGAGAAGRGGAGGAAAGQGLQGPQLNQLGAAAASVGDGFIGRSDNAGRFVGNRTAGQQTVDAGSFTQFGGFGGQSGAVATPDISRARGGQMRIPQRIAFTVPPLPKTMLAENISGTFVRVERQFPGISAVVDDNGVVILQGTAATDDARALAAALVRLEPGVREIRNEIVVVPTAP